MNSLIPIPLFDTVNYLSKQLPPKHLTSYQKNDFSAARDFLSAYADSVGTFNSYRREVERLLQWSFLISKKNLPQLKREDLENFFRFCKQPKLSWIGIKKEPRFIEQEALRLPNPNWKPFVATVSKLAARKGVKADAKNYELSPDALKESFVILNSFFNYLLQEEYLSTNPIAAIRQKSKFIRKKQELPKIRRLSTLQWQYVINTAQKLAISNPKLHERTLFIMSAFYLMYLRISELAATARWTPSMNHFFCDHDNNWWFVTVGKGNKQRQIAVCGDMLLALKRWRKHLNLTTLPSPADHTPLVPKITSKGAITDTSHLRKIVQSCFDQAIENLNQDHQPEEAELLTEATVHWLRHTGISEDVKRRPREHVRDDAGHSSSATTDRYIDIELKKRHESAKNKHLLP